MLLEKATILLKILFELSSGSVSEYILTLIEELYALEGIEASEAMKAAYCAVSVESTVTFLNKKDKTEYFHAVKRIWKERINKKENVGLKSEQLMKWSDEIDRPIWEDTCWRDFIRQSESLAAVDAVISFLKEVNERIGAPFLAENFRCDDRVMASLDSQKKEERGYCAKRRKILPGGQDDLLASIAIDKVLEALKLNKMNDPLPKVQERIGAPFIAEVLFSDNSADITAESDDEIAPHFAGQNNTSQTFEVFEDSLVPTLETDEAILISLEINAVVSGERSSLVAVDNSGVLHLIKKPKLDQSNEGNEYDLNSCLHNAAPKPTIERNDSIEGSPSSKRGVTIPSPRMREVSPLKKNEPEKVKTRKKVKRWTQLEVHTLECGIRMHGVGNWKAIFDAHPTIFRDRDPVALKDKWRNMSK